MKKSAGILVYRLKAGRPEVFLVHPGGPFFARKDGGAWSVPKGEFEDNEDPLAAAQREFEEETGRAINGRFVALQPVKQKSGKIVYAWAVEGDIDPQTIVSNTFEMEWPKGKGKKTFPEIDKAGWFTIEEAKEKLHPYLVPLVEELEGLFKVQ